MILQIETTNICNAHCTFCPHSKMERAKGVMHQKVFDAIMEDVKKYPIDGVAITGIGETLLDSMIIPRVRQVKEQLGVEVTIYTNGTNLKKYLPDLLSAGLNSLVISLNAVNGTKRKELMGIDLFDDLAYIIDHFYDDKKNTCKLTVCAIPDMGNMERFDCDALQKRFPIVLNGENIVYFHYASNWAGKHNFNLSFKPANICPRPFEMFHILWTGEYCLCCLDYEGEITFGKTIAEVITNEKWKHYREMLKNGKRSELYLCGNCSTV